MNKYKIYTRWVAFELRKLGFHIVATEPNPRWPQFDIYIFEDTEAFQSALTQITKKGR